MDLRLTGKRALITGGSRGIGLAVAEALLDEGVDVALAARGVQALDAAVDKLSGRPARALAIPVDTTDDESVRAMAARATELLGGVDILVNAAAEPAKPGPPPSLTAITDDALRAEMETKVLGYLRCARALAPGMVERGWGRIINISGLNARWAGSLIGSVRNVSVAAMTKNLADELGPAGINVTVVHPAFTVTERTPDTLAGFARQRGVTAQQAAAEIAKGVSIGRLVTAAEVASVVAFLASPRSVAITGDAVPVGGGQRGPIYY
ncbi:MAG TPA: SDR family oxidoreductase [Pseudonocardia sp.]|jgi:NAD(P)-dependent dehydrogenase (short-subunit alcohol dehydrogenase family)|uniref:SDR family NAD(P)-dependent oxidoreductase n=1 Tax=Pseudonocardia sp. TaxID=60912 RepID=UPI002ED90FD5